MSSITVTASVTYTYDTDDSPIRTKDDACEDVWSMLANGEVSVSEFTFTAEES